MQDESARTECRARPCTTSVFVSQATGGPTDAFRGSVRSPARVSESFPPQFVINFASESTPPAIFPTLRFTAFSRQRPVEYKFPACTFVAADFARQILPGEALKCYPHKVFRLVPHAAGSASAIVPVRPARGVAPPEALTRTRREHSRWVSTQGAAGRQGRTCGPTSASGCAARSRGSPARA